MPTPSTPWTLKPGSADQDVAITLRPSPAVKGRVVGPDGQPVRNALVISRVTLQPNWIALLIWTGDYRDAVRDGSFAVHGLPADTEVPVYFLDAKHNLGATAMLSGRSAAGGAVTVRLQPCGAARARLVDPAGKPVAAIARRLRVSHDRDGRDTRDQSAGARIRPTRTAWRPIRTSSPGSTRSITRRAWSPMPRASSPSRR